MLDLYPPQQLSHDVLVDAIRRHGAALDSSCTGSGKTVKAVEIARTLGATPLVVCPKAVIPVWRAAFAEQGVPFLDVVNYEMLRTGNTRWLRKTNQAFDWWVQEGTLIIYDEVHRCGNGKTKNAKILADAVRKKMRLLMLSATAAEDPSQLKAIGYALGLHNWHHFITWAIRWGCALNPWRKLEFHPSKRPRLEELHRKIYPDRGHKISRDDMGYWFAVTSIVTDPLDFGDAGEIQKLYDEMSAELDQLAEQSATDRGANALTAQLRARQHIELLKIPALADMVKDKLDEGRSVAVFLNFRQSMDALAGRLAARRVVQVHGDQTAKERQACIDTFQADRAHVIICQLSAGGVGISLHDIHGRRPRVSFISPSYNAKDVDQALGRIDRAGAKSDTVQYILFAAGTIEEDVAKSFRKKLENMRILHADLDTPVISHTIRRNTMTTEQAPPEPEQQAHAKYSPSKLKYLELCPGWQGREGPAGHAAEMGTRIHKAIEEGDFDMLLNDFERLIAERCTEAEHRIRERHRMMSPDWDYHEARLDIDLGVDDLPEFFGTCDRLLIKGSEAVMIDWKTGKGAVEDAEINTQAQGYVLGAFQQHPELEVIHFYFVIPQRDEISFHTYRRSDCDMIRLRLTTIMRRADQFQKVWNERGRIPSEQFNPQPNLCEYCSNQWRCHAITEKVFAIARKYGTNGIPVPDKVHGSETEDPAEMAKLLTLKPIIKAWLDGVDQRAKQMVFEEGLEIPGYVDKERAGGMTILSALGAWEAVKNDMPVEDFLSLIGEISFNTLGDAVYKRAPKGRKTKAKNELEYKLDEAGLIDRKPPVKYLQAIR